MPAASCPSTIGKGRVQSPLMTCQSLWQTPVAITRTLASPAWGPCCSTSTTSSGVFALYRIAAFITAPPVWRGLGDGSLRWAQSSRIRAGAKARRVLRKCDRRARWLPEVERFEKHRRPRSEERRVGKERRAPRTTIETKKKKTRERTRLESNDS